MDDVPERGFPVCEFETRLQRAQSLGIYGSDLQGKSQIFIDSHVWEQSIVLEYHADISFVWGNVIDGGSIKNYFTVSHGFKSG